MLSRSEITPEPFKMHANIEIMAYSVECLRVAFCRAASQSGIHAFVREAVFYGCSGFSGFRVLLEICDIRHNSAHDHPHMDHSRRNDHVCVSI